MHCTRQAVALAALQLLRCVINPCPMAPDLSARLAACGEGPFAAEVQFATPAPASPARPPYRPITITRRTPAAAPASATAASPPSKPGTAAPGTWPGSIAGGKYTITWRRQVLLALGDSLTQQGQSVQYEGGKRAGWVARLASAYDLRADIWNRGFGGYTSASLLEVLPEILQDVPTQRLALTTVWTGINDSSYVQDLQAYKDNLKAIVQRILAAAAGTTVVLMTPAPINDAAPGMARHNGRPVWSLSAVEPYARAAREVAAALPQDRVLVLDVWRIFLARRNWRTLLARDGGHLSVAGNDAIYEALMELINSRVPHLSPERMPMHHPSWDMLQHNNLTAQFAAEREAWTAAYPPTECSART